MMKIFLSVILFSMIVILSSCKTAPATPTIVIQNKCYFVFPIGGPQVAKTLVNIPYEDNEPFWDYLGRIDKLGEEVEALCEKPIDLNNSK